MNLNFKSKVFDLFHPLIIVVMVILFLIIAMPMWYIYKQIPAPNLDLYIYVAIGLLFFIIGIYASNYLLKKVNSASLKNENSKIPSKLSIFKKYSKNELILASIVFVGILLQIINILLLGGIPLFSATLKAKATTKLWLISYIIFLPSINILLAKYNRKSHYILLILGIFLFALTGYRTTPIAIMLSSLITLYYTRDIDFKYIILILLAIAIVLVVVGFIAVQAISWQHWTLNPLELVSHRAAFTLNILSTSIQHQYQTMGNLFYSTLTGYFTHTDPRVLVGNVTVGREHSITATIFGPALLDFGIVGMIIQMFLLGLILKTLHKLQKHKKRIHSAFYGILLAQTIIWIETGPNDIVVWLFYLIGIFIIIKSLRGIAHDS